MHVPGFGAIVYATPVSNFLLAQFFSFFPADFLAKERLLAV